MKAFRRMYIYKDTHLPAVGWLQGCFLCYSITGQCETFSKKQTSDMIMEYVVYVCPTCKKLIIHSSRIRDEYKRKINDYITLNPC